MRKLTENQANVKQHTETEPLLVENYSHSSSTLSSQIIGHTLKKLAKEQVCLHSWYYMINHNQNKNENEKYIT